MILCTSFDPPLGAPPCADCGQTAQTSGHYHREDQDCDDHPDTLTLCFACADRRRDDTP